MRVEEKHDEFSLGYSMEKIVLYYLFNIDQ